MNIVLLKSENDHRVGLIPSDIKKLTALGNKCFVLSGIGSDAGVTDEDFKSSGATLVKKTDLSACLKKAEIIVSTKLIKDEQIINESNKGALFVTFVNSFLNKTILEIYKKQGIQLFAMEMLPRITRMQNMDILSSQSNLAGYRAVLEGLCEYGRVCPMMTTAAGTIKPSRFLIIGTGVAGLQAIATAKRMGGVVVCFDVRAAAKEQVESLGAKFIEVEHADNLETEGGYAKETTEEYKKAQAAKLEEEITKADIIITSANIPGKAAPKMISEDMIKTMKRGSVIVDLAAEMGGNTALTKNASRVKKYGVLIIGEENLASKVAESASVLFSKNVLNLLTHIIKDGKLDKSDDALNNCYLNTE